MKKPNKTKPEWPENNFVEKLKVEDTKDKNTFVEEKIPKSFAKLLSKQKSTIQSAFRQGFDSGKAYLMFKKS